MHILTGKDRPVKRIAEEINDVEELRAEGRKCTGCPHFAARRLQEDADIIFAPCNYPVDSRTRDLSELKLDKAMLVIDEAHKIEDCRRSAGSMEIPSRLIDIVLDELVEAVERGALLGVVNGEFINSMEVFRKMREHTRKEDYDV